MAGEQWSFQACVLRHPTISPPTCSSRTGQATPSTADKPHKQEIIDMQVMCGTLSEHEPLLLDPISICRAELRWTTASSTRFYSVPAHQRSGALLWTPLRQILKNFLKGVKGVLTRLWNCRFSTARMQRQGTPAIGHTVQAQVFAAITRIYDFENKSAKECVGERRQGSQRRLALGH